MSWQHYSSDIHFDENNAEYSGTQQYGTYGSFCDNYTQLDSMTCDSDGNLIESDIELI